MSTDEIIVELLFKRIAGVYSGGATPVPIPNTEVKSVSGDGTTGLTLWESSTIPAFFLPDLESNNA